MDIPAPQMSPEDMDKMMKMKALQRLQGQGSIMPNPAEATPIQPPAPQMPMMQPQQASAQPMPAAQPQDLGEELPPDAARIAAMKKKMFPSSMGG